jgi:hypothetical protein
MTVQERWKSLFEPSADRAESEAMTAPKAGRNWHVPPSSASKAVCRRARRPFDPALQRENRHAIVARTVKAPVASLREQIQARVKR